MLTPEFGDHGGSARAQHLLHSAEGEKLRTFDVDLDETRKRHCASCVQSGERRYGHFDEHFNAERVPAIANGSLNEMGSA
jgi:hypothetical protein